MVKRSGSPTEIPPEDLAEELMKGLRLSLKSFRRRRIRGEGRIVCVNVNSEKVLGIDKTRRTLVLIDYTRQPYSKLVMKLDECGCPVDIHLHKPAHARKPEVILPTLDIAKQFLPRLRIVDSHTFLREFRDCWVIPLRLGRTLMIAGSLLALLSRILGLVKRKSVKCSDYTEDVFQVSFYPWVKSLVVISRALEVMAGILRTFPASFKRRLRLILARLLEATFLTTLDDFVSKTAGEGVLVPMNRSLKPLAPGKSQSATPIFVFKNCERIMLARVDRAKEDFEYLLGQLRVRKLLDTLLSGLLLREVKLRIFRDRPNWDEVGEAI